MNALLAKITAPIVFRVPGHDARKFFGFARAEQGSMLDLRLAASLTPSPERSALYLRHALDESRHAHMFSQRSAELRRAREAMPFGSPTADTEHLFETLGEPGFLAFVHRGERRGCQQFEQYQAYFERSGDAKSSAMFESILKDERQHEAYTRSLLIEMAGSEQKARALLRQSAAWEAWRKWRRAGRTVAKLAYGAAMMVLYVVLLPFALVVPIIRPAKNGWQLRA